MMWLCVDVHAVQLLQAVGRDGQRQATSPDLVLACRNSASLLMFIQSSVIIHLLFCRG